MSIKKVKVGFVAFVVACTSVIAISSATTANAATGWCSGVKIAAYPGGPQGGAFANNVYNGYKQAAEDLGADVKYYFSDWDSNKLIQQMKEGLATNPDGMAIYGFGGAAATKPIVVEAFKKGTIVTSLNSELTELQKLYATKGFGYVGAQLYKAGFDLATETIKRAKLKKGDKTFVWGLKGAAGDRAQRTVGAIDGFKKNGMNVVYLEIDQATNTTPAQGASTYVATMKKNAGIKAVITDHGGLTGAAATYMKAANQKPGSVFFSGFDVTPAAVTAMQEGYLTLSIDQQPYLQGYLPILQICLTKKFGFSGLTVNTSGGFLDKGNLATVAPLAIKEIR